jgi:hypothetical protein
VDDFGDWEGSNVLSRNASTSSSGVEGVGLRDGGNGCCIMVG